jgi:hypothetical protein
MRNAPAIPQIMRELVDMQWTVAPMAPWGSVVTGVQGNPCPRIRLLGT